jgi:hypothetical protein
MKYAIHQIANGGLPHIFLISKRNVPAEEMKWMVIAQGRPVKYGTLFYLKET